MKLFLFFTLAGLIFANPSTAWELPQRVLDYFTGFDRIPPFIRETQNPWLQENRLWLGRLKDTRQALCSLDSDIRPGNGGPRTYPSDLYKELKVNNRAYGLTRGAWKNTGARLQEMLDCPAALQDVGTLYVNVYISDGKYGSTYESPIPPDFLPELFVDTLTSMPNLTKLSWNTNDNGNDEFQLAFHHANVTLPSVRHLIPAQKTHWLTGMCPNIETLESGYGPTSTYWRWGGEIDPRMSLIYSAASAKNLSHFSMEGEWELEHVDAIYQVMRNITNLTMSGELPHRWSHDDRYHGQTLKEFVAALSSFPRLTTLEVPHAGNLDLDFDGGAWCGNAYFGKEGRAYGRSVSQQSAEVIEEAAAIIVEGLPRLENLSIGGTLCNITRDEDGKLNTTWPWTGRMEEWTYEMWPETGIEEDYGYM